MFKPRLEALEDRQLLATQVFFSNNDTVLNIIGDKRINVANLTLFDDGSIGGNIDGTNYFIDAFDVANLNEIYVDMGKGNDVFRLRAVPGVDLFDLNLTINAHMGHGNDTFLVQFDYGNIVDSNIAINVWGGSGNDDIRVISRQTGIFNSNLAVNLWGGSGNDYIFARTSNFIDFDSSLSFNGWGEKGNDVVRGAHTFFAGSEGSASAYIEGGKGRDNLRLEVELEDPFDPLALGGAINANNDKDLVIFTPGISLLNVKRARLIAHPFFIL